MLGLHQLFPFVLLFALPSLGLTDEKDFLFVFPRPPSRFIVRGGGSISFSPLSLFSSWSLVSFSAFPLLLAYGHCKSGAREPPILWAV